MSEFVLKVQDIDDRGKDYAFPLTDAWLDSALQGAAMRSDPGASAGRFTLHAQRNGREILVRGRLSADLLVECSRCLGDAPLHVETSLTALLDEASETGASAELEPDESDPDRARYSGNEVILDDLVREHLVVESPMKALCSPECEGIQVPEHVRPPPEDFGTGRSDPRLAPLEQLRDKLSGNKE